MNDAPPDIYWLLNVYWLCPTFGLYVSVTGTHTSGFESAVRLWWSNAAETRTCQDCIPWSLAADLHKTRSART